MLVTLIAMYAAMYMYAASDNCWLICAVLKLFHSSRSNRLLFVWHLHSYIHTYVPYNRNPKRPMLVPRCLHLHPSAVYGVLRRCSYRLTVLA